MKIVSILCFLIALSLSEAKWVVVDSMPTHTYEAIECYDKYNCVAIGNNSFSMAFNRLTTDGGNTWTTTLNVDSSSGEGNVAHAYSLSYPGKRTCIIGGGGGYYWLSKDNAQSWEKKNVENSNLIIRHIKMLNEDFGILFSYSNLYLTSDGGLSWNLLKVNITDSSYKPDGFNYLAFPDSNLIIVSANRADNLSYIIKSSDRGKNWVYYPREIDVFGDLFFKDSLIGFTTSYEKVTPITRKDIIYKTTDGGKTWIKKLDFLAKDSALGLKKIVLKNNFIFAFGDFNHYWISTDIGETWKRDLSINNLNLKFNDYFTDFSLPEENIAYSVNFWGNYIYKNQSLNPVDEPKYFSKFPYIHLQKNIISSGEELILDVDCPYCNSIQISLINTIGQLLDDSTVNFDNEGKHELKFNTDALSPGMYFIAVKSTNNFQILKVVVL